MAGVGDGSRSLDAIRQRRQSGPQLYAILLIVTSEWRGLSVVLHRGRELRNGIWMCVPLAGATCRGKGGSDHVGYDDYASCRVSASRANLWLGRRFFEVLVPFLRATVWEARIGRGTSGTSSVASCRAVLLCTAA
jgi:hypothetical protein